MSRIGNVADFQDNSSSTIQVDYLELLLVKRAGQLFLYRNLCPHSQESLDPMGGSVAHSDALLIVCQRHGAEFLTHSGECVSGPCQGEFLEAVPFTLSDGAIYLD